MAFDFFTDGALTDLAAGGVLHGNLLTTFSIAQTQLKGSKKEGAARRFDHQSPRMS
jgi:hypothetical protein